MPIEITVPVLPESVTDAELLAWHKQVGERAARDEILVEVETDKIVLEVTAPADGVVTEILHPTGATVKEGEVLARFEAGEAAAAPADSSAAESTPSATVDNSAPADGGGDGDARLSPAVRRMVEEHGLDITVITGSGPGGRVTKEDVLAFIADQVAPDDGDGDGDGDSVDAAPKTKPSMTPSPTQTPSPTPPAAQSQSPSAESTPPSPSPSTVPSPSQPAGDRTQTRAPMSRLRRTIAARLVEAQQTAALLTTFNEVNMQPVMDLRARYKDAFEEVHGARLGLVSLP